jgi:hypothetical protein
MSGPFLPARAGQPLDILEQGAAGGGWEALEALMKPHLNDAPLQPEESVAEFMWGMYNTPQGRAMFEWMMDISIRQPLRVTGTTIEQTALLSAGKQGINGFAESILKAIAHGEQLVAKRKTQNGAGS